MTALGAVGAYTIIITVVIVYGLKLIIPIRVDQEAEFSGLDITSHGERAYDHTS